MANNNSISVKKLFLLCAISFWPLYLSFSGKSIVTFDGVNHYFPLRENAIRMLYEGQLPLWNSFIFCGMSLIGDAISNPFDILNVVFIFLDPVTAAAVFSSLQLFLSGAFMYIYLRRSLHLKDLSALLGGILYIFNPVLILGIGQRLDFINPLGSFLWLPLILLLLDKAIENKMYVSLYYTIFSAVAMALSVFSGSINIVFYMAIFLVGYIFLYPITMIKKIALLSIFGIITILLTAIQLFPMFEALINGHRALLWSPSNYEFTAIDIWSLFLYIIKYPVDLIFDFFNKIVFFDSFITLHFKVNIKHIYIGIFNLFLIFLVYLWKVDKYKIKIIKLNAVMILLFLVSIYYLPIKGIVIYFFPILKSMHISYVIFLFYFCIIVLTAYIFDVLSFTSLLNIKIAKYLLFLKRINFTMIILIFSILLTTFWIKFHLGLEFNNDLIFNFLRIILYFVVLYFSFYTLYKIFEVNKPNKILFVRILFILMVSSILMFWEFQYIRNVKSNIFHKQFEKLAESSFLKNMNSTERMEIYIGNNIYWSAKPFGFNSVMFYKASISGGCHQFMTSRHRKFFDAVNRRYPFDKSYYWKDGKYIWPSGYAYLDTEDVNLQMLNLLGVKYLFSPVVRHGVFLKNVEKGKYYYIYENLDVYPRCFIVHGYEIMESEEILNKLSSNSVDFLKIVLLEKPVNFKIQSQSMLLNVGLDNIMPYFVEYKSNKVTIRAASMSDGFLVLTDSYDKGWKAYIDGEETEIFQANYLFRAIVFPKGEHVVIFKYMPLSFVFGAWLSISFLIVVVIILLFCHMKIKKVIHE